jgi:4-amino-4-deoxy-L-arabinose transferase-like glycosyltransferase
MEGIKKRIFYIFLALHVIFWTLLQLLRNVISLDSMEAIQWGELLSFGTNKHPPLSGWLMAGFYNLLGKHEILIYLLGQLCLLVGFIFVYKLAKFFMTKEKAFCATMVLEFCFYYTYYIYVNSYNCNVLLMGLVPVVIYYFYKSVSQNKTLDWITFGITSGLAFLGKYQIVFVFLGMLLYLLISDREQFKKSGMYLAILTGSIVILPHVIWLFKNDFFSFTYMLDRTASETHNMPLILVKLSHITYPIKFIGDQILAVLPCVGVYLFLIFQSVSNLSLPDKEEKNFIMKFKNFALDKVDISSKKSIFLLCIGIIPILFHSIMGLITGSRVPGIWGSIMVSFVGVLLFYFIPIKFNKDSYTYFVKWCYFGLFASLITVGIFGILQTKYFIAYPTSKTMTDFDKLWDEKTNNSPLKYVAGDIKHCFHFKFYHSDHPTVILETFGHKNPWVDHEDIIKSGAIVVGEDEADVIQRTKEAIILLPNDYKITPEKYTMSVCNKIGKCEENEFFYTIIPPAK